MKIIGSAPMSNFDFEKLRQQIKESAEQLKKQFKGNDNQLDGFNKIRGIKREQDSVKKSADSKRGKSRSDEVKNNISKSKTGVSAVWNKVPKTEETKQKLREKAQSQRPYVRTEETKKKNGLVNQKQIYTPQGIFASLKQASECYSKIWNIGSITAARNIRKYCQDISNKDWYYID